MNKAVFLDRDGTINEDVGYIHRIDQIKFIDGVKDGLRALYNCGFLLFIITNQSGIGRGYYTEQDYLKLQKWIENQLKDNKSPIAKTYYCPHVKNADIIQYRKKCACRKPKVGMFYKASKEYNIDFNRSYALGDRIRDLSICHNTYCKGFLIGNTESENIISKVKEGKFSRVKYVREFQDAVLEIIERESKCL